MTGAAGIVGPGICMALREAGWQVAAAELNAESFERHERFRGCEFPADLRLVGDVTRREECIRLVQETVVHFGSLTLLVNNATAAVQALSLQEITEEFVQQQLGVDLLAPLYLIQAAETALAASKGSVVNFSSVMKDALPPRRLLYGVAKSGIEQMTTPLAMELAERGVRVNTIRVGSIPGDAFLRQAMMALPPDLAKQLYDDVMPAHLKESKGTLTGESGRPSDIGAMVAYLASEQGAYINGAVLPVDGAYTATRIKHGWEYPAQGSPYVYRFRDDWRSEVRQWLKEKGIDHEI